MYLQYTMGYLSPSLGYVFAWAEVPDKPYYGDGTRPVHVPLDDFTMAEVLYASRKPPGISAPKRTGSTACSASNGGTSATR